MYPVSHDYDSEEKSLRPVKYSEFSQIASRYDAIRDVPAWTLLACYDRLVQAKLFPNEGKVLDAACGTGQMSLPLAERDYEVHGIDISKQMVDIASTKLRPGSRTLYTVADVCSIPEEPQSFDAVVVSKLLERVWDWQRACRELVRVAKPGAHIVQINERGVIRNSVRRYFSGRADELGFRGGFLGSDPHSKETVADFMASLGCEVTTVDMSDVKWDVEISYSKALGRIQDPLFTEYWYLPTTIYDQLVAETISWIEAQPDGLQTVEYLNPYLVVEVFRTPTEGH
jgi:ubiquinone/menaquinone biosynthesis C-methylase UbiE